MASEMKLLEFLLRAKLEAASDDTFYLSEVFLSVISCQFNLHTIIFSLIINKCKECRTNKENFSLLFLYVVLPSH